MKRAAVGSWYMRNLSYDASGCLRKVEQEQSDDTRFTTSYVCGQGGARTLRKTKDETTGEVQRVVSFAGLAEIRPDDGVLLVRLTLQGSTVLDDARSLTTGQRVVEQSAYVHKDLRGSVLLTTSVDGVETRQAVDYDPWGNQLPVADYESPLHAFVDHEPDPGLGYYGFGARVYDRKEHREAQEGAVI